ncbi:GAF domain-containing sensor histidine kinase [Rugamonas aquatica]|uniref:histidine kinase n=1 Tax=Rugamonas aquatica TaxID=2743357 RepID=A0A6A7N4A6_9BURK|nr:histidine kinase [Rugamonas aquatica]MQA39909.1 histidine kinase [Rugamonas aquatica]
MAEYKPEDTLPTRAAGDAAGATMVFEMRLLLSISAVLTLFISPADLGPVSLLGTLVFLAYALHSGALYVAARRRRNPFWHGKVVYWIDLGWYALMVYFSGGNNSFFVPFFFFVILTASFQWGFDEGARITLASALLVAASALAVNLHADLAHLLLRITFVLGLGYMIAYWGGLGVAQRRRLALLRDVSRLSNPRFGVDQTLASLLAQIRHFYRASNCILLINDADSEQWLLRSSTEQNSGQPASVARMGAGSAAPLLAFPAQHTVLYAAPLHPRLPWSGEARALAAGQRRWEPLDPAPCAQLADLFDGRAFISTPLPLRKGRGRLYVVSAGPRFTRSDATFLLHVAAQAFPVIENIELLDRMASDAAFRERQKIARDLHDSTIQPYIGLRHALTAMRQQAAADNPLTDDLEKLIVMSTEVIANMRSFARNVRKDNGKGEPELMVALRRQAAQVLAFYSLDVTLQAADDLQISDRLAAEVFQMVNEGMSNIRKHTHARAGRITLSNIGAHLQIDIENDNPERLPADFLPGSLAERAAALGGGLTVAVCEPGVTRIRVTIPM